MSAAHAYADARGYKIIHEYVDRAMTGRNDNRDAFQQMLTDCAKKQFQVIIVWKVDRFGRNREEITFNKYRAKKNGVRVEYVAENLPDSPESVILESVLEGMAEYYSLQLSQNVRRGYLENAKKCKYAGGRIPLGYKLDEDKHFIIDPDTAPIVRSIFEMYAGGKTITEIIEVLNAQGLRTSAGQEYTKNSLRSVLKNVKYMGLYTYKDEIKIEGGVPAIVDKETFEKVQKLLKHNQKAAAHKGGIADYLLTGKLFCGYCGALMAGECGTSKTGRRYHYYLCSNRKRRRGCKKKAVPQGWIESYVLEQAQRLVNNDEVLQLIADSTWEYYLQQDKEQAELKVLQKQLADTDKAISNLVRAIEAGILNDATKSRMDELNQQRDDILAAIAGYNMKRSVSLTKDHILFFLEKFKDLDYTDPACQKRLIELFVNSVYVYDDHLTIAFNYGGENSTLTFQDSESIEADESSTTALSGV